MNRNTTMIAVVLVLLVLVGAGAAIVLTKDKTDHEELAKEHVMMLVEGEFQEFYDGSDKGLKEAVGSVIGLREMWRVYTQSLGDLQEIESINMSASGGNMITTSHCLFENWGLNLTITFNSKNETVGLFFGFFEPSSMYKVPDGLKENPVVVVANDKRPLPGILTTKGDTQSNVAVFIVHGSGANSKDADIGPNKPYRDIAWGLALQDIDVLRYDKRTYVYGNSSVDDPKKLTVKEETMDDAVAAAKSLKEKGYKEVYMIGHSLGGMLGPAIVAESDGAIDGLISLAGSPRTLSEIQYDQNWNIVKDLPNADVHKQQFDAELAKVSALDTWTESQLLNNKIFGLSGYYIKDMISRDAGEIAKGLDIPMLFLQGSEDLQVFVKADFNKWKDILREKSDVQFIEYYGLNHLFMESQGDFKGTLNEYYFKGNVDQSVINDIAKFIRNSS